MRHIVPNNLSHRDFLYKVHGFLLKNYFAQLLTNKEHTYLFLHTASFCLIHHVILSLRNYGVLHYEIANNR